jgi:hypothetical protein
VENILGQIWDCNRETSEIKKDLRIFIFLSTLFYILFWCLGPESNRYSHEDRGILSLAENIFPSNSDSILNQPNFGRFPGSSLIKTSIRPTFPNFGQGHFRKRVFPAGLQGVSNNMLGFNPDRLQAAYSQILSGFTLIMDGIASFKTFQDKPDLWLARPIRSACLSMRHGKLDASNAVRKKLPSF